MEELNQRQEVDDASIDAYLDWIKDGTYYYAELGYQYTSYIVSVGAVFCAVYGYQSYTGANEEIVGTVLDAGSEELKKLFFDAGANTDELWEKILNSQSDFLQKYMEWEGLDQQT